MWLPLPHSFLRSGRCSSWRVSLFYSPRSVIPQSWLHLPPKNPFKVFASLIVFVCRGQPPFRVLLACGRSCCYGLSHFLLLTFSCWHSSIHSVISFILFLCIPSFTPLSPTARKSCHSFTHFVPFHSFHFQGICIFPPCKSMWLQPCSVSLHTASPPHSYTLTVHSLQYTPFALFFQPLPFPPHRSGKKMRQTSCRQHPSTALRASCVRGTRSTRIGSHTTHRLNTSFRYSPLAFQPCYPPHAQGCFYYSV